MKKLFIFLTVFLWAVSIWAQNRQWKIVWREEFNSDTIDLTKWGYDIGGGGWGNNELQYYTDRPENSYIHKEYIIGNIFNGFLVIRARKENYLGYQYTSARMKTRFKGDWKYGRIEVRARLPKGQGIWPAIWMLPTDWVYGGWPASGEIDIMEFLGHDVNRIYGSAHFGGDYPIHDFTTDVYYTNQDFSAGFHIYAFEWDPDEMRWYMDGNLYKTLRDWYTTKASFPAPFDQEFHLILNVAVGGNWPGYPDATTVFPESLIVDWVRVYQDTAAIPRVELISPQNNQNVNPGTSLNISAEVHLSTGTIAKVQFFQDKMLIGEDETAPYEVMLHNLQDGTYRLRVRAVSEAGIAGYSPEIRITVGTGRGNNGQSPYGIIPHYIPGIIETEYYDIGGEGVAYHDLDATNQGKNNQVYFRMTEGVDVELCQDPNGGDYNIGWVETGEWLEYTVYVQEDATYHFDARVSSPAGGAFRLLMDGTPVTGVISVPATGGWQNWSSVSGYVPLTKGIHVLRIAIEQGQFNMNRLQFSGEALGVESEEPAIPSTPALYQNFPNPFNPVTTISFYLPEKTDAEVVIFNGIGEMIKSFRYQSARQGTHTLEWNASDLPSGIYFYQLKTDHFIQTRKMILVK